MELAISAEVNRLWAFYCSIVEGTQVLYAIALSAVTASSV